MKQDQFKNRYIIKLSSSVIITVLNIVIQLLLPRALSVEEFGYYSYNLNVFTAIVGIANLQTSNALVAKFSKRNEEIGIIRFYFRFCAVVAVFLSAILMLLYSIPAIKDSFMGQTAFIVMLGFESAYATRFLSDDIAVYDALAISRFPAMVQVMLKAAVSIVVIAGFLLGRLTLVVFYVSQAFLTTVVAIYLLLAVVREQKMLYPTENDYGTRKYFKEFFLFCRPLVVSNLIAQGVIIFMNWALMRWSGTSGQAMFGVAWQLNSVIVCLFSPYAELSKREFSLIVGDREELRRRYTQALKLMMWLTCYFALFIGVFSDWILPIVFGGKYNSASLPTFLIMVYTVYQAWGQISGALQLALERTKIIAIYGVAGQIVTLLFTFLFQIPNKIWENGLGAVGIALTYMCGNIMMVHIALKINSKLVESRWKSDCAIQIIPLLLCGTVASSLKFVLKSILSSESILIYFGRIVFAGLIYTFVIGLVLWKFPDLLGLSRDSIVSIIKTKRGSKE